MLTIILSVVILGLCMIGLGVGVIFFGKVAKKEPCSSIPEAAHEDCPSQKAGICPIEDKTGTLKLANRLKINH